ncbi:MAG: alkaline phosphatase family protein [Promethearchaeota archaeon]|jgi:arylsulfatase A-like enzyme
MSRSAKVNQVILIILDDIRAEHLFEWMKEGKLPNIAELANEGITCQNCVTSFPSVTLPCYADIITGSNSGYFQKEGSGVPNYHWLNRLDPPQEKVKSPFVRNYNFQRHRVNKDIGSNVKTIFEQVNDGNLLSASSFLYRGSTLVSPQDYRVGTILTKIEDAFRNPAEFFSIKEAPLISVALIPQTDGLLHQKGFDHSDYKSLVIECDNAIGFLIRTLKDLGYYKDTAICVTTDHGNYKALQTFDLEPFFQQEGLTPYQPKRGRGDFDANLGGVGFFNFRGDTWHHHPTINQMKNFKADGGGSGNLNLFESIWKIPGVKIMYYRDDDNKADKGIIHLESRDKKTGKVIKGKIEYYGTGRNQKSKYVYNEDEDIFGFNKHDKSSTLLDNKSYTIDEWIPVTLDTNFINIVDQLPRHFKNPRSCDIMVSTKGEYCYNYEHGKTTGTSLYSHDIASRTSMLVPLIIGGSLEIPKKEIHYCKTTDIVPTLLDLLGKNPHSSVIGKSVLSYRQQG